MKKRISVVAILICLMLAGLPTVVFAAENLTNVTPEPQTTPAHDSLYQDDAYFKIADPVIKMLSNKTVPTGTQQMKVYSAYIALKDMSVSPDTYDVANAALNFLYYTAMAGQAYEDFFSAKKSVAAMTDGSEYYDLARANYITASDWWAFLEDRYPNVTVYKMPEQTDPFAEESSAIGESLEGLKYPLVMVQKAPNTEKPYQDQEIITTMERWIEDNIDTIPNLSDLKDQSPGTYFITSDGPKWAKSTLMTLSQKNVDPDFYDTANYINAFLYYLAQSRENYDEYLSARTSMLQISDGQEKYDSAKSYYEEAGVALTRFIEKIPDFNGGIKLPEFPKFDEIPRGRLTEQEKMDQLGEDSPWGGSSWTGGKNFN